ncbi:MAG TPA: glycosyltransferase family A protein, partial [Jatrophihabitans sp.]|nr:glycosyltransferase family A protein [Jatrophihabitans sp.]
TYNSPAEGLARVLRSIDAQSLHPREFEVVFVDDGSTDDTPARLAALARHRPNVVVHRIPNSGWASRPRNVGVSLARGEYVLFMDHDDELLPTGLERAYEFGHRHGADVVNAKEVRTTGWSWAWDVFSADVGTVSSVDPNPLIPMTPHKLYRRAFLLEQDVTFPEGKRVLWEDIYFNTLAFARGARVAVLSSYALYHWVIGPQNTSKSFGRDITELWRNLESVLDYIATELAGRAGRDELLAYQFRSRVLAFLGPRSLGRTPEQYAIAYAAARRLLARYESVGLDARLPAVDRARLGLLRADRPDAQRALAELDRDVTALPELAGIEWDGSRLVLSVTMTLLAGPDEPLRLVRDGERWLRPLPEPVAAALPPEALDVTADLARARVALSVKGRSSRSTWPIESDGTVDVTPDGRVVATVTGRFDALGFGPAHDLTDGVWDFAARLEVLGYVVHRGLRGGRDVAALLSGRPVAGYVNRDGLFSLDVGGTVRSVVTAAGLRPEDVAVTSDGRSAGRTSLTARAALPTVHNAGQTDLAGQALLGPDHRAPARLAGGPGGASLTFTARLPDGRYPLRVRLNGRTAEAGVQLVVRGPQVEVTPA